MAGTLYIVPVPIGNLADITQRALEVLAHTEVIACEDTRTTRQLLRHYKITPQRCLSYHAHNEQRRAAELIRLLLAGTDVALVSDAGTPLLSDPGYILITQAIAHHIPIVPLPGATAFIPALIASGFRPVPFLFLGFPPQKKRRRAFIEQMLSAEYTVICYEAPHRIRKLLRELEELGAAERRICLAREITKRYEEFLRGTVSTVLDTLEHRKNIKGEIVVVLEGKTSATSPAATPP